MERTFLHSPKDWIRWFCQIVKTANDLDSGTRPDVPFAISLYHRSCLWKENDKVQPFKQWFPFFGCFCSWYEWGEGTLFFTSLWWVCILWKRALYSLNFNMFKISYMWWSQNWETIRHPLWTWQTTKMMACMCWNGNEKKRLDEKGLCREIPTSFI